MKSLHKSNLAPQIANLMRITRSASTLPQIRTAGATPLSLSGPSRRRLDPPGGLAAQFSLPLCVRPSFLLKAKGICA